MILIEIYRVREDFWVREDFNKELRVRVDFRVRDDFQYVCAELSDTGLSQIYMPPGFAHGFCVWSDCADLHYKVSATYDPGDEGGLLWRDENIGIQWPIDNPIISNRDDSYPLLVEL